MADQINSGKMSPEVAARRNFSRALATTPTLGSA